MRGMICSLLALSLGCSQAETPDHSAIAGNAAVEVDAAGVAADVEALRAVGQRALVAFREDDAATVDALYAEGAVLVNPGAEPVEGRAAIDSLHRAEMARAGYVIDWESIRVEASESGDLGYVYGRWSARSEDGALPDDHGYFVNVFRKVDGTWRTIVEVNGSSEPWSP